MNLVVASKVTEAKFDGDYEWVRLERANGIWYCEMSSKGKSAMAVARALKDLPKITLIKFMRGLLHTQSGSPPSKAVGMHAIIYNPVMLLNTPNQWGVPVIRFSSITTGESSYTYTTVPF